MEALPYDTAAYPLIEPNNHPVGFQITIETCHLDAPPVYQSSLYNNSAIPLAASLLHHSRKGDVQAAKPLPLRAACRWRLGGLAILFLQGRVRIPASFFVYPLQLPL